MNIKIVILPTGQHLIAKTGEATREIEGETQFIGYVLTDPEVLGDNLTLTSWVNGTSNNQFLIIPQQIVTMCDPTEELIESYISKVGTDGLQEND